MLLLLLCYSSFFFMHWRRVVMHFSTRTILAVFKNLWCLLKKFLKKYIYFLNLYSRWRHRFWRHPRRFEGRILPIIGRYFSVGKHSNKGFLMYYSNFYKLRHLFSSLKSFSKFLLYISLQIENHYRSKRDIEWGLKDGTLFLFQVRN